MEGLTAYLPEHHLDFPGVDQDNFGWCSLLQFISIGTKLLLFFLFCTEIKSSSLFKFLTELLHSNGTLNMFGVCFGKKRNVYCNLETLQHKNVTTGCKYDMIRS